MSLILFTLLAHEDVPFLLILLLIHQTVIETLNIVIVMHIQDMMQVVKVKGNHPRTVVIDAPAPIRGRAGVYALQTHRAVALAKIRLNCYYCYCCDVLVGPFGPIKFSPCYFELSCIRCICCLHVQQYPVRTLNFTFHIFP